MPRGNMPDEILRIYVNNYCEDAITEAKRMDILLRGLYSKLCAVEKDFDEALGEISDLRARVMKLEQRINPEL